MNPLLAIVLGIAAIGLLFLAVERRAGAHLRKVGPWLVVAVAGLCVGAGSWLSHDGHTAWRSYFQPRELLNLASQIGFLALFGTEAVLMGRWLLRTATNTWLYLATFTLGTFVVWLVTFFALASVMNWS